MRKKYLIEKLNRLEQDIAQYKEQQAKDIRAIDYWMNVANERKDEIKFIEAEKADIAQQRAKLFKTATSAEKEKNYLQHIMNAVKVLNNNLINFELKGNGLDTTLTIHTYKDDEDGKKYEVVVKLSSIGYVIETPDGLNGFICCDKWSVSSIDIELYRGEGKVYYWLNLGQNLLKK